MGDFNSNAIWNKQHGNRNHSNVVKELKEMGIVSAYHEVTKEEHGKETKNTFFLHKNTEKPYHIDYCFAHKSKIINFEVYDYAKWKKFSDHSPICAYINLDT